MKPIRIGQIGVGHEHASGTIDALLRLSDLYEVVGVVEEENPRWRSSTAYEGVARMTEEELLDTPGLHAVAVETNMPELVPTAMRCMERGLHMHLDKPGGEALEPFRRLIDGCRERSLAIQLGYMYRTNPAIEFCFRAVREGWLGEIFQVDAVMSRYDSDAYREFLAGFPGGAMYNFGSHLIDLVVAMLGRPENVVAFQKATRDDGLNDNGLAVLEYRRATATVRSSIVEADGMMHRRLVVCGTNGTVEICPLEYPGRYRQEPLHVRLTLREGTAGYAAGTRTVNVGVMNGRYDDQLIELARIIRGEIENPYSYEHELHVQETLLAAAGYTTWETTRPQGDGPTERSSRREQQP
ncbi:MAG: Gfo/Idh/MocA family protein [Armatimonadota bacterium]